MPFIQIAIVTIAFLFGSSVLAQQTSVKVRNFSNNKVHVAVAYSASYITKELQVTESGCDDSNAISKGWYSISPNETRTFRSKIASGMCLRIIDHMGNEIVPPDCGAFRSFPTVSERFRVCRTNNSKVIRLLTGFGSFVPGNDKKPWYKNSQNVQMSDKLPRPWEYSRYFVAKEGIPNGQFDILPGKSQTDDITSKQHSLHNHGPKKELILDLIYSIPNGVLNSGKASLNEARCILSFLTASTIFSRDQCSVSGRFGSNEVTIWVGTYGKCDRYGVRYGKSDGQYICSNQTYFEITQASSSAQIERATNHNGVAVQLPPPDAEQESCGKRQRMCIYQPIPPGWVKTGETHLPQCGNYSPNNAMWITNTMGCPSGTRIKICPYQEIPKGWVHDGFGSTGYCGIYKDAWYIRKL